MTALSNIAHSFYCDPQQLGIAQITRSQYVYRGCSVEYEGIQCGNEQIRPGDSLVELVPEAPPVLFRGDGMVIHGDDTHPWRFSFPVDDGYARIKAKRVLDVTGTEALRWRLLQYAQEDHRQTMAWVDTIRDRFPDGVIETDPETIGQGYLIWTLGVDGFGLGAGIATHPKALPDPDVAREIRRRYNREKALYTRMRVVDEVLRYAFLRHLPSAMTMPFGQTARLQVNGRWYWLKVEPWYDLQVISREIRRWEKLDWYSTTLEVAL